MPGFSDVLGHEQTIAHMKSAIEANKVSHAYLLAGEKGSGKKMLAGIFARTLQCEAHGSEPCGKCHSCIQAESGNQPDIIYVTHEKPGSISVDDIRGQVNGDIQIKPYSSPYKIYIIDEAEKLTQQAQNALLKTMEEPPAYAVILLLTTNVDAFLPTILSRCVQLKLKPLRDYMVKNYLTEQLHVQEADAEIYSAFARGNLGKAISLASSEDFKHLHQEILGLLRHVKQADISELLDEIRKMKEDGLDISECLDFIQLWYRDILLYKVTKDINQLIFKEEFRTVNEISQNSGYDGIEQILEAVDKARVRLDANVNMELAMELLLLTMKEN